MDFVKKSVMGYKTADKEDATHAILDIEEYRAEQLKIFNLENSKNALMRQIETERRESRESHEAEIQRYKAYANRQFAELKEKISQLEQELKYQTDLQEGLKRICRERANSERNIRPKKKCMGYVEQRSRKRDKLWRTSIQTPYKTSLEADLVIKEITKDIQHSFKKEYWDEFRIADIWEDLRADFWMVEIETEFEWKAGWMK